MTVSALVLTLDPEPVSRTRVLERLRGDARLCLGDRVLDRLPVVAMTTSCAAGDALFGELGAIEGILKVDVVAVDFSEDG